MSNQPDLILRGHLASSKCSLMKEQSATVLADSLQQERTIASVIFVSVALLGWYASIVAFDVGRRGSDSELRGIM